MERTSLPDSPVSLAVIRALAAERAWQRLAEYVKPAEGNDWTDQPEVLFHYADALWRLGEPAHALEVTARIEQVVRRSGNRHLLLDLVNVIGMALFEEGRIPDAEDRFEALLEHATAWENDDFAARASNNLGILASIRGRNDEALLSYKRALVAYQKLGSMRGLAQTHHNMGICYRDLGYQAEADRHFERAISLARDDGSPDVVATAETERAMLRVHWGDPALARVMATRAIQTFEQMADPLGRADALRVLAAAARADGDPAAAADLLQEALATAHDHANPLLIAEVQRDRATLFAERGDLHEARKAYTASAENFRTLGAIDQAMIMEDSARSLDTLS